MIHVSMIPQEVLNKYNIKEKAHTGYIISWVSKGMYGLPQAGIIANYDLVQRLELYVLLPPNKTLGLRKHKNFPINFGLVVDDFGIKYSGKTTYT